MSQRIHITLEEFYLDKLDELCKLTKLSRSSLVALLVAMYGHELVDKGVMGTD